MARGYKEIHDPDDHDKIPLASQDHLLDVSRDHQSDGIELEAMLLQTIPTSGLSTAEVDRRRAIYGYNELTERKPNHLLKFLSYFVGPIAFLIELACIISIIVKVKKHRKKKKQSMRHALVSHPTSGAGLW